jgi:hypothetical protein
MKIITNSVQAKNAILDLVPQLDDISFFVPDTEFEIMVDLDRIEERIEEATDILDSLSYAIKSYKRLKENGE